MIKIAQVTLEILNSDEIAQESLSRGVLNLTAYAKKIKPLIEKRLYKPVRIGSIVTSLSRIAANTEVTSLKVPVRIEDMSIKSPLCELSYERNNKITKGIADLVIKYSGQGFFTSTQGIGEITIIASQIFKDEIIKVLGVPTIGYYDNLSAITVRFIEKDYIEVPNMIYTMVSALAVKHINLIEIVSTFTEISFIVSQQDIRSVVDIFKENFLNV